MGWCLYYDKKVVTPFSPLILTFHFEGRARKQLTCAFLVDIFQAIPQAPAIENNVPSFLVREGIEHDSKSKDLENPDCG